MLRYSSAVLVAAMALLVSTNDGFSIVPKRVVGTKPTTYSSSSSSSSSSVLRASEYLDLDSSAVEALLAAVTSDKVVVEPAVTTAVAATAAVVPSEMGSLSSTMDLPLFDVGSLPVEVMAGAGVLAVAAVLAVLQSQGSSADTAEAAEAATTPAPVPAAPAAAAPAPVVAAEDDISIPYDAAARLAYCKSKGIDSVTDEADFATFKTSFEAQAVADATAKKAARDKAMA